MPTVSMLSWSWVPSSNLVVPSLAMLRWISRERPIQSKAPDGGCELKASRKALGKTDTWSRERAPLA